MFDFILLMVDLLIDGLVVFIIFLIGFKRFLVNILCCLEFILLFRIDVMLVIVLVILV